MNANECHVGDTVYLIPTHRKGVVLTDDAGLDASNRETAIVEWAGGQIQRITLRSLLTEAQKAAEDAKKIATPPVQKSSSPKKPESPQAIAARQTAVAAAVNYPAKTRVSTKIKSMNDSYFNRVGEVLGPVQDKPGWLLVEWDKDGKIDKISASTLMLEADVQPLLNKMEAEFDKLQTEVGKKLDQAASLIREAHKMASDAGEVLENLEVNDELFDAMDTCGWRTSSLSC